jgi:DNA-binding NtrC family response regulator
MHAAPMHETLGDRDRAAHPPPISTTNPSAKPTTTSSTILVVDDDPSANESFARMLQLEGFHVITTLTAAEGLEAVEKHAPHAILLDLRMPEVDGLGFLQQLRKRHKGLPVAIVTGDYFVDDTMIDQLRDLGAETWFKPLWLEDLLELVNKLLEPP